MADRLGGDKNHFSIKDIIFKRDRKYNNFGCNLVVIVIIEAL